MSDPVSESFSIDDPIITDEAEATEQLGEQFGQTLNAGDVVVLTGPLGSGKTTFTRGLARGVGITDPVTSPTYAIAFVHESSDGGPNLVHVDAYRLTGLDDLETVDLEPMIEKSITVIEWGRDYVESLTDSWYEVTFDRSSANEDSRQIEIARVDASL